MPKYPATVRYYDHETSEFDLPHNSKLNSDISKVSEVNDMDVANYLRRHGRQLETVLPTSYHQSLD